MSFDVLADDRIADQKSDWLFQVSIARRRARNHEALTNLRNEFIREHALKDPNPMGQGPAKNLPYQQRQMPPAVFFTAKRKADDVLTVFPRYSARLLLSIRLLTPMLTKDDDPFYLFDNPVRKDHILGLPCLSAAAIKGLAADAYQRAFPGDVNWREAGQQAGVHQFRRDDHNQNDLPQSALRLFGIADGGANTQVSQIGRLHFSPLWFDTVQFLVMNPGNPEKAIGTIPIQFEAIAPDPPDKPNQTHEIEVIYCNPYGTKDTDEIHVRADLARFLAALAVWWPALGIGAKRLAGYGAIQIIKAELQAVGWTGLGDAQSAATSVASTAPEFVTRFMTNGLLIDPGTLQAQFSARREAWKQQPEVQTLEKEKENLQALPKNRRKKERDRINKQLAELRQALDEAIASQEKAYSQAVAWLKEHPEFGQTAMTDSLPVTEALPIIGTRTETGPDSWLNLAQWIARETT